MDDWVDIEKPVGHNRLAILPTKPRFTKSTDLADSFYTLLGERSLDRLKSSSSAVFHVDLGDEPVYTTFLNNMPAGMQQEYDCSACRHFANRNGGLALVKPDGTLEPVIWSSRDLKKDKFANTYGNAVRAIQERFVGKKVTKELMPRKYLGSEKCKPFSHMYLHFPDSRVSERKEIAGYTSATTAELAVMLERVLSDYDLNTVRRAHSLLKGNKLPYASNHIATIEWLLKLLEGDLLGKSKDEVSRHNLLYRYAATSFVGSLKQLRSGALATLLENIKDDASFDIILRKWSEICDPAKYIRPTAAPSEGNIAAAERLFEKLGLTAEDLKRRLLVQDDVPDEVIMWKSERMRKAKKGTSTGTSSSGKIFEGVQAKEKKSFLSTTSDIPPTSVSFTHFVKRVLPKAKRVECWLGSRDHITTGVTGLEGTKPLMIWHDEQGKNLASFYGWVQPPAVESHGLKSNAWNEVRCLIPYPNLWDGTPLTTTLPLADPDGEEGRNYKFYHKSKGFRYVFVLEENHESRFHTTPIFPEYLKGEFHGVRSTIEAHCRKSRLLDVEDGPAKGGFVAGVTAERSSSDQKLKMRVMTFTGAEETYKITLFE